MTVPGRCQGGRWCGPLFIFCFEKRRSRHSQLTQIKPTHTPARSPHKLRYSQDKTLPYSQQGIALYMSSFGLFNRPLRFRAPPFRTGHQTTPHGLGGDKEKSRMSAPLAAQNRTFSFAKNTLISDRSLFELDLSGRRSCLLHQLHQLPEAVHHIVLDVLGGVLPVDFVEELAGTLDLGLLDLIEHHRRH